MLLIIENIFQQQAKFKISYKNIIYDKYKMWIKTENRKSMK